MRNFTKRIRRKSRQTRSIRKNSEKNILSYWNNIPSNITETENNIFEKEKSSSTYGYMTPNGFAEMLKECMKHRIQPPTVFYDLGSGLGMPVTFACIQIPTLKKSIGVELSITRHEKAKEIIAQVSKKYLQMREKIMLINDNILSDRLNYTDADIIWISSLCFTDELSNQLANKLNKELKPNTNIFTSKAFINLKHSYHYEFPVEMSWSSCSNVHHYVV